MTPDFRQGPLAVILRRVIVSRDIGSAKSFVSIGLQHLPALAVDQVHVVKIGDQLHAAAGLGFRPRINPSAYVSSIHHEMDQRLHPHRLRDLDRSVEGVLIRFHGGALFDNVLRPQAEQQSALLTMRTITFDAFVRHGKRDLGAQANP